MEHPTCETCSYFVDHGVDGTCHRAAPQPVQDLDQFSSVGMIDRKIIWPVVDHLDWCGEHPDFPAYIASLKLQKEAVS